jgi:flagellar assembly protein FliH
MADVAMTTLLRAESVPAVQPWTEPPVVAPSGPARPRTVRELQEAEEAVWREVREAARAEALAEARAEIESRLLELDGQVHRLAALCDLQARPLARIDADVERQLAELAIAIARQLVRRELKIDPSQVIAVVRETVALLPASARDVRVIVHPDDAALIRERLATAHSEVAWHLLEDPMLSRGDCRVTTHTAQIDARMESRLNAAIAALLGDERAQERQREREQARNGAEDVAEDGT